MASTFYASADGTVFHPVSDEARRCSHDSSVARERLAQKLASRKLAKQRQQLTSGGGGEGGGGAEAGEFEEGDANTLVTNQKDGSEYVSPAPGGPNNDDHEIAIRRIEERLKSREQNAAAVEQRKHQRGLVEDARFFKGNTKALPANYVRKVDHADNKHARAIVHHTGSHYVMAGSRQFQHGLRVKGVVSRHSKQGARLQARRVAARNASGAREDARGQRADSSRSLGKQTKGKKKKKKKAT